jgi:hypothetical protein
VPQDDLEIDMKKYRMELGVARKATGSETYVTYSSATCGEYHSEGFRDNIAAVMWAMHQDGIVGLVDIYRDGTPVFLGRDILAEGRLMELQMERLKKLQDKKKEQKK